MSPAWEVLATRARGLGAHLLTEDQLRALQRAGSLPAVAHVLSGTPYAPFLPRREQAPAGFDQAVARTLASHLETLARWAGPESGRLAALFLDEDVRSVRGLLRGIIGGLAPERRIAGSIPTPTLDRGALETLAHVGSAGSVAATLVAWNHPLGAPLLAEASRERADLFRLEAALGRGFALHATARRPRAVHAFVSESITCTNLVTALLLVGVETELAPDELYVQGADRPTRADFARAAGAGSRVECSELLATAMRGTIFEATLARVQTVPAAAARDLLGARVSRLTRDRLRDPTSPASVILLLLRLRQEAAEIRRASWGASFSDAGAA